MTGSNGNTLFLVLVVTAIVLLAVWLTGPIATAVMSIFAAGAVFVWWPVDTGSDR